MGASTVIGIDASRIAVDRLTGTETYTYQLLSAMARLGPPESFRLYLNKSRSPIGLPALGTPVCIPFPRLWTHTRLSFEVIRHRPDLLFVPAHVIPLVHPRSVVTIHDLGYLHHPEAHPALARRYLDWSTRWSVRAARRIIAISETTKADLVREYRADPARIEVVHHGIAPEFRPSSTEEVTRIRHAYGLPERYVFSVGTLQPRKNYGRLASAIARLNQSGADLTLVIAGKRGWLAEEVELAIAAAGLGDRVRLLGYVPDNDLPALYSGAEAYCQPSLYEGFGMPVLEAMACGTPVVAAGRSALPEIGADAALYCDPFDANAIANALRTVFEDSATRERLIARGFFRAAEFSWERCAQQTLAVLRRALTN